MEDDKCFGPIVKEHRRALDLTQAELARRVACCVSCRYAWEANFQKRDT
jgi:DNA-binding transcriptional regulator YiaG